MQDIQSAKSQPVSSLTEPSKTCQGSGPCPSTAAKPPLGEEDKMRDIVVS